MMKGLTLVAFATAALSGLGPQDPVTALPDACVCLNDGGAATRPATKAGAFRLVRGTDGIHDALPSHFLRVEFKTGPVTWSGQR